MLYEHTYTLAFVVPSYDPQGADVDARALQKGLFNALHVLTDDQLIKAVGEPYDTEEMPNA